MGTESQFLPEEVAKNESSPSFLPEPVKEQSVKDRMGRLYFNLPKQEKTAIADSIVSETAEKWQKSLESPTYVSERVNLERLLAFKYISGGANEQGGISKKVVQSIDGNLVDLAEYDEWLIPFLDLAVSSARYVFVGSRRGEIIDDFLTHFRQRIRDINTEINEPVRIFYPNVRAHFVVSGTRPPSNSYLQADQAKIIQRLLGSAQSIVEDFAAKMRSLPGPALAEHDVPLEVLKQLPIPDENTPSEQTP